MLATQNIFGAQRAVSSRSCCRTPLRPQLIQPCSWRAYAGASNSNSTPPSTLYEAKNYETVADAMTATSLYSCKPEDTVDDALEMLVQHRITGLPVVDASGTVVGVVSDYDLLALDKLGSVKNDKQLFPAADETWQAFKEVKILLAKSSGKKVADVMTATPITVHPETDLDAAATLLLSKKIHRLPVVDAQGQLVGVLSRGNLVKAALAVRKAASQ
ncbi:inosine-5'-monophosphate dehydrogenase [Scenedesmus sp. NREL 46B-D3]|nr:inosine-5'-monophosphate dehydrogenase [Scenedesmus sp. NREL 46B-D3]